MLTKDRFIIPMELELPDIPMEAEPSYGGLPNSHSVSGEMVSFVTDISYRLGDLKVGIEAVQSGSGDPSPTNIRPISGWDEAKVTRTGKNLFDKDSVSIGTMNVYNTEGQPVSSQRSGFEYHLPSGTYTLANSGTFITYLYGNVVDANRNFVSFFRLSGASISYTATITLNEGEYLLIYHGTASALDLTGSQIQIELGSTATAYKPYNGNTYEVTWQTEAGTVYGGTLDVTTGVLTVTHKKITLDGTQTINASAFDGTASNAVARWSLSDYAKSTTDGHAMPNAICDKLKATERGSATSFNSWKNDVNGIGTFTISTNGRLVAIALQESTITNGATLNTWLSDNPITAVYELATPQTYQLTPTEVMALLGQNNVWADCGDIENLVYFTIDEIEAPVMLSAPLLSSPSITPALADLPFAEEKTIEQEEEMPEEEIQEETLEEESEEQPEEVTEDEGLDR